jgi:4-amino-4-deoxy-L-arabinose transferase-like glycosyltransferase
MTSSDRQRQRAIDLAAPRLGLLLALGAAALLRVWSLHHGVPFSVEVDEPEVMERAVRMIKTADFNPHFFDYPSLYMYVEATVAVVRFLFGAMHGEWRSLAQASTGDFYVWARAITAFAGTATVWLVYRIGMRWDARTALLAASLLTVMPLHVRESHFVLTDVPATFFVTLTLLLTLRAWERPLLRRFALAGAAAGLAGATKYNAGLVVLTPVLACVLVGPGLDAAERWRVRGRALAVTVAAMLAAFLIAAPYTFLDLPTFLNQFARLASEYRTSVALPEPVWLTGLKHLRNALDVRDVWPASAFVIGPGSLVALGGLALGLARILRGRDRARWLFVTAFVLVYFWFVSRQNIHYARYLLPLVPGLCLLSAAAIVEMLAKLRRMGMSFQTVNIAVVFLTIVTIAAPAYTAIRFDADQGRIWTSQQAYDWIRTNVPRGESVVLEGRALLLPMTDYRITIVKQLRQNTIQDYAASGVHYLVASSQCYGPYLDDPRQFPTENAEYQRIFGNTEELARFTPSRAHPGPELRVLKIK